MLDENETPADDFSRCVKIPAGEFEGPSLLQYNHMKGTAQVSSLTGHGKPEIVGKQRGATEYFKISKFRSNLAPLDSEVALDLWALI